MYNPSYSDTLYADIQPSYSDSLAHHGIKGMKWGVRRFQNPDGTRTSAGRAREKRTRKGLSKKQKDMLKTAGLAALGAGVTAATVYGTSKLADKTVSQFRKNADNASENAKRAKKAAEDFKRNTAGYDHFTDDDVKNARESARRAKEERDRAKAEYERARANQESNNSQQNYYQRGQNTSNRDDRKRREEKVKASGKNVSYEEASKRVKDLRDRVAQAQRDGTLTPDLINELKDAQAQARVAKQQMGHAVWIINADKNYLAHCAFIKTFF